MILVHSNPERKKAIMAGLLYRNYDPLIWLPRFMVGSPTWSRTILPWLTSEFRSPQLLSPGFPYMLPQSMGENPMYRGFPCPNLWMVKGKSHGWLWWLGYHWWKPPPWFFGGKNPWPQHRARLGGGGHQRPRGAELQGRHARLMRLVPGVERDENPAENC